MSRRFGRQQKKKMRAALAVVSADVMMLRQLNDSKSRALTDIEFHLREFLSRLPENSVFKPLRDVDFIRIEHPYLNVQRNIDYSDLSVYDRPGSETQFSSTRIPLVHIFTLLEQNVECFTYDLWLRAQSVDDNYNKGYVFSVSRDAFERSTGDMRAYVHDNMARQLERSFWPRRT